jgi:hypothetical protein
MNGWFSDLGNSAIFLGIRPKALPAMNSFQGVICHHAGFPKGGRGVAVVFGTVR